jgi:hypothetical protein
VTYLEQEINRLIAEKDIQRIFLLVLLIPRLADALDSTNAEHMKLISDIEQTIRED